MKRAAFLAVATVAAMSACTQSDSSIAEPESLLLPVFARADNGNFSVHATGDQEVPANDSRAQGQAIFRVSDDGSEIYYKLIVANIQNVAMAHIHIGAAGENGGVAVWLYPSGPPPQLIPGRSNGVLAEGVITAADLQMGLTMEALLVHMRTARAYVNVHTSQYPGGEVRGQLPLRVGGSWTAELSGANERPVPVTSDASGRATFTLNRDGTALHYTLDVENLENTLMAHIHVGAADATGGVIVWLYPSGPPPQPIPGTFSGRLAEGIITDANITGMSLLQLIGRFELGTTYVNVHTQMYPAGEIRGQIR